MAEVAIRLKRLGGKKRPHSRIVVIPKRNARDGKAIEELGYYDPSAHPPKLQVDVERAKFWLERGASVSPTVKQLLKRCGSTS
jgi:small subunit ribosomal protein S16